MDDRKHGDVDLKDCVWGKKYLSQNPVIDSAKVGIIGGSYGGYMTMAALAFQPDEFDEEVDLLGITNCCARFALSAILGIFQEGLVY